MIDVIERLKSLEVSVRAGRACRRYKAVKLNGPDALVFQSVAKGAPMRDNNILTRHITPAARKLNMGFVNWQVLRRSCATWLQQAGVDVKDAQGILRHSRASTTQDVYQQLVPESQQRASAGSRRMLKVAEPSTEALVDATNCNQNEKLQLASYRKWWPGTELNRRRQPFQGWIL